MDIIPEHGETESLRRMPADATGKMGLCQPGGVMSSMADSMEEAILEATMEDLRKVKELLALPDTTKHELIMALGFLYQSAKAAVEVAEMRGERLA
ncbi:hypothetical protein [Streptomyces sp. NPDC018972]|jgi:hypothetical protein|uniref:hypothetical protein n=1 Tax=Streptomyces sp. NPDC018972 TaxID=3365060 RepID=UPI0037B5DB01